MSDTVATYHLSRDGRLWFSDSNGQRVWACGVTDDSGVMHYAIVTNAAIGQHPRNGAIHVCSPIRILQMSDTLTLRIGYDRSKNPETRQFRSVTLDEIKSWAANPWPSSICPSHIWFMANDGTARQMKINGRIRTWKRDPNRIEIPCKYGLYKYHTFTELDYERILIPVQDVSITEGSTEHET